MKVMLLTGAGEKMDTAILLSRFSKSFQKRGSKRSSFNWRARLSRGAIACYKCSENKDRKCAVTKDHLNEYLAKMIEADGILLGSPVYFADATARDQGAHRALRHGFCGQWRTAQTQGRGAVAAVRRAGAIRAFDTMNHLFQHGQMIVVGSSYWNVGIGRNPGQVKDDAEGLQTMETLGKNMAWLLKKING